MALDVLMSHWGHLVSLENIKCHPDVLHFLGNCISPKGVAVCLVEGMDLIDGVIREIISI
jgi:hypothetical protein